MYDTLFIDAHAVVAYADSSDSDSTPDEKPAIGTVILSPSIEGPTTIISEQTIVTLGTIICTLDAQGNLQPPADGIGTAPSGTPGVVAVVCPQSPDLLEQNWTWSAEFRPATGQGWRGFTISNITGAPGETVRLTTKLPTSLTPAVRQAAVFFVEDFDPNAPVVPDDFTSGADLIWRTSDNTIFEG